MRKLQKLAALGLAGSMALSLAACGGSAASSSEAAATAPPFPARLLPRALLPATRPSP